MSTPILTTPASDGLARARGMARLLNTTAGRVLCLAGAVDAAVVDSFHRHYGAEPARVDVVDARSVTFLGSSGLTFLLDHLAAAERSGRPVALHRSPPVDRALASARVTAPTSPRRRPGSRR
jgi:anti-anti-sigma regulatory factor